MKLVTQLAIASALAAAPIAIVASSGACNKQADDVACSTANSSCNVQSPNCGTLTYAGTVTTAGTRKVITSGKPGKDNSTNGSACSYVCTITSDCANLSPAVNGDGGKDVLISGNNCP
jgi:hypothetical protein